MLSVEIVFLIKFSNVFFSTTLSFFTVNLVLIYLMENIAENISKHDDDWKNVMFSKMDNIIIGQRLGVSYQRSQESSVMIQFDQHTNIEIFQLSMGLTAISGVVWDAGLLTVDYMISEYRTLGKELGNVLDLGTGTGICGIVASYLGAGNVILSDILEPPTLEDNLSCLPLELRNKISFVPHDWSNRIIPLELMLSVSTTDTIDITKNSKDESSLPLMQEECKAGISNDSTIENVWDVIICSDLLYEQKSHLLLLDLLSRLNFHRAIFSYKKRHDEHELAFFTSLSTWCHLSVIPANEVNLLNLPITATSGLFIVDVTRMEILPN